MSLAALVETFPRQFPSVQDIPSPDPKWVRLNDPQWLIPAQDLFAGATWLKSQGFDLLTMLTAVDYPKTGSFELVYLFVRSQDPQEKLVLKVKLERVDEPVAPSLTSLYHAADWQERETYDLFGIRFEGHPHLKRILLWEGFPGWPLRKDYVHTPDCYDNGQEIGLPAAEGTQP